MPNTTTNYNFYLPLVNDPTDQDLWGGYLNANFTSLDTLINGLTLVPAGSVVPYAGSSAPSGWLLCYGQSVSASTYATLFGVIGTTFGGGSGNFNLPDMRGRIPAGQDNMGGSAANRITAGNSGITGTTLGAAGGTELLHGHGHSVTDPGHTHSATTNSSVVIDASSGANGRYALPPGTTGSATTGISIGSTGGGSSQNVQPSIILNYIIKT